MNDEKQTMWNVYSSEVSDNYTLDHHKHHDYVITIMSSQACLNVRRVTFKPLLFHVRFKPPPPSLAFSPII